MMSINSKFTALIGGLVICLFVLPIITYIVYTPNTSQAKSPAKTIEFTKTTTSVAPETTTSVSSGIENIRYAIANRNYDQIVKVETTIQSALDSITDATRNKKYLLYIPNGTYNETGIQTKSFVDMVGESREGTILQSSKPTNDTLLTGGRNVMIANMTINHTTVKGETQKYPIHADKYFDKSTPANNLNATIIFKNLSINALGNNSKHGVGIGSDGGQRIYFLDCDITSEINSGVHSHNEHNETRPMEIYYINTNLTGAVKGMSFSNLGSLADFDRIGIFGGKFRGGTGADIAIENSTYYLTQGQGEVWISIDENVDYESFAGVDPAKKINLGDLISIPTPRDQSHTEFTGTINTSASGSEMTDDSIRIRNMNKTQGDKAKIIFSTYDRSPNGSTAEFYAENMDGMAKTNFVWKLHTGGALPELMRLNYQGDLSIQGMIKTTPVSSKTCNTSASGGIMFDSDDNHFYGCNGTNWVKLDN